MFVGRRRVFVSQLAMVMSGRGVMFGEIMFAVRVMMCRLVMMMRGGVMMRRGQMVMFVRRMFCHVEASTESRNFRAGESRIPRTNHQPAEYTHHM